MNKWHTLEIDEIYKSLETGENGLSSDEAANRLVRHGKNELKEAKRTTLIGRFLMQFKDVMVLVLLAAAIISGILGEIADSVIILAIVVINAAIGVFQESKAEKALEALKNLSKPFAKVVRDGIAISIRREDIVPGDLVELEAGDYVPADLRLIHCASLKIQESALTGESAAVEKSIAALSDEGLPLGDRVNMAYSSSIIAYGRGSGIVVSAGMDTEVGKIAEYIAEGDIGTETPLKKRLNATGKILSIAVIGAATLIFITGMIQGRNPFDMFMTSVSLAVAAIPEGLPAIVTVVLAIGVQKMSSRNAIVRKLPAVETLGSTQVICSDKTGTLTLNRMSVEKLYIPGSSVRKYPEKANSLSVEMLMNIMVLCNDSRMSLGNEGIRTTGDPTETALVQYAFNHGFNKIAMERTNSREYEIPFDSNRKLMTTINRFDNGFKALVKGAPDMLIERCSMILVDGKVRRITSEDIKAVENSNASMSEGALRVLAYAYKDIDEITEDPDKNDIERNLVFTGLTGMIDPPRAEAKEAIKVCRKAGMRPVMITGDHRNTAFAIARQLGMASKDSEVITGRELDKLTDGQLARQISRFSVFARVSPEHKVRIVRAWKSKGKIVAMTGDGVNDAPSLKAADIGIGMGITGTDVAKSVADMILADDNFATIIVAVEEGRKTYDNIRKAIQFLLSANTAEVIAIFVATLLNWRFLFPIHILWINLVTDSFPALSLGLEKAEPGIMEKKPRDASKNLFSGIIGINIIYQGILQALLTLAVYFYALGRFGAETAVTMAFVVLGLIQLFHVFNVRSTANTIFRKGFFTNPLLFAALAFAGLMQISVVLIPGLNGIFRTVPLTAAQWLITAASAFAIIPLVELVKLIVRLSGYKDE
ncbi:MAG: cation-translocating P-type ATPase [Clostridia bacterium]|nr:cation-translocating P-type ATPase [Clostridia bacterium]